MSRRKMLAIGLVAALIPLVVYSGAGIVIFNRLTATQAACDAHPEYADNTPVEFQHEAFDTGAYRVERFESVAFPSREDNLSLNGWFIPAPVEADGDNAGTVIIVHGHNDCKGSATVLTAAGMLHRNGFNSLVLDLREHGASQVDDGRTLAGLDEYRDVLGAWDWLQREKNIAPQQIGLMGFSLGAATVTIASSEEPGVAAVWEDSSFAEVGRIVNSELRRSNYPTIFGPATSVISRALTGEDVLTSRPVDALQKLNGRPFFIVHGGADERIPVEHAWQLAAAAGSAAQPWIVPGADHTDAIFMAPDEYEMRLVEFFEDALRAS